MSVLTDMVQLELHQERSAVAELEATATVRSTSLRQIVGCVPDAVFCDRRTNGLSIAQPLRFVSVPEIECEISAGGGSAVERA